MRDRTRYKRRVWLLSDIFCSFPLESLNQTMFGAQMLFFIALFLIPDDVQPQNLLDCAYSPWWAPFCTGVSWAHDKNQEALNLLVGDFAKNGTKRLKQAEELVLVLSKKDILKDVLAALKEALNAELGALVRMKADCYEPVKPLDENEEEICRTVYGDIGYAALGLIKAFVEVEEETKTATIKEKLSQKFPNTESPDPSTNSKVNFTNAVYALGREVLEVM